MGIVNVTPDSFSDGGQYFTTEKAIAHGRRLVAEGASWLDVGGESSRPGADEVSLDQELSRVVPVVEALKNDAPISIDTVKADVARAAVDAGATLVNDISASLFDVAAQTGVGWVAMHRQGTAKTMQDDPRYDNVVAEVCASLRAAARRGEDAGVSPIYLDPGIGFGKHFDHNLALLANLDALIDLGYPVLIGASRKAFIGEVHRRADRVDEPVKVTDRLEGSLAVATWAFSQGVAIVRVHDVAMTMQALRVSSTRVGK